MKRIFIPTSSPSDWKSLLAKPTLHWKMSYSAMTTAACWEAADGKLPEEIKRTLEESGQSGLANLELLAAFPEWEVALPGGQRPSQSDVMALTRNDKGLVVVGVEAKVDEPFGPTLGEKRKSMSVGQKERLDYLHKELGLNVPLRDAIRYQLLHRAASATLTARAFHAPIAVMLIHSFRANSPWRNDFEDFCSEICARRVTPNLFVSTKIQHPLLYLAWCEGNASFLNVKLP